ncbi:hypothetical protein [Pseudarthrobacter sp. lyk4-40-TYG-27]|uniref:hypothetical protein n=1 Tax=Pseudarthrobacter sp. lyk4-40-TYG-27 TaxID=3040305 RepID=UPI0025562E01|nr:hypothetical protein [Pseudarthrobacter sp. lyk4-40-TYG-27]
MTPLGPRAGVFTRSPAYVAAAAGLPASARLADDVCGAVAVIPGSGNWWAGLLDARDEGAAAVVIADPAALPREVFAAGTWSGDIPVVVDRPGLRADMVANAVRARRGTLPRVVTVECAAPAALLDAVIRDGLGWARTLTGSQLTLRAGMAAAQGVLALLDSPVAGGSRIPSTLVGTALEGPAAGGLIQVLALGEVRTEVAIDHAAGRVKLETSTVEGALRAPERYEAPARLALRRAIEAASSGREVADLQELLEDQRLAHDVASARAAQ